MQESYKFFLKDFFLKKFGLVWPREQWSSSPLFTLQNSGGGEKWRRRRRKGGWWEWGSWPNRGANGGSGGGVALGQTVLLFFCIFLVLCFYPPPVLSPFSVLLLFLFSLSTMFSPLCSGFVAVLLFLVVQSGGFAVADDNSRWLFPYSLLLFPWFSFSSFFCFCSLWFQRQFPPKSFSA